MIRQRPPQVVLRPLREGTEVFTGRQRPAQRRGLDRQHDVVLAHGPTRRARLFIFITLQDPPFSLFAVVEFSLRIAEVGRSFADDVLPSSFARTTAYQAVFLEVAAARPRPGMLPPRF